MFHRFSDVETAHRVSSGIFDEQLRYLKKHFNVIPLSQLRESKEKGIDLPKKSLVLTVDDGYRDFYDVAYPLLRKYELPATLFVTTGFINKELWLWPDKITWLLDVIKSIDETVALGNQVLAPQQINDATRPAVWGAIVAYLLSIGDEEKHIWIEQFAAATKQELPLDAPLGFEACSWGELKEMQSNGVELGGHTHTHPSLGQVTDKQLSDEIETCARLMKQNLGKVRRDFCFPNGQPGDYNDKVKRTTKQYGFCSSVTAFYDAKGTQDLYEMRRHTASEAWFQFYKSVNGVEALMAKYTGAHNRMDGTSC